jgi:hypothetical protein
MTDEFNAAEKESHVKQEYVRTILSIQSPDLSIKSDELTACVKSFFEDYLNIRECSDAGYMWAPIAISCARAMKLEPLGILIERMRVLSGAREAQDE